MERLTSKIEDAIIQCPLIKALDDDNDYCKSQNCDCDNCKLGKQLVKLAKYENAEEQGLLLRLPVAEGSKVWEVKEYFDCKCDYDCHESIHFKCDLKRPCEHEFKVYRVIERKFEKRMLSRIGTTIFLTKEEAEAALAKMKEV